jgi:hypothetical protein
MRAATPSAVIIVVVCLSAPSTGAIPGAQSPYLDNVLPSRGSVCGPLVSCVWEEFAIAGLSIGLEVEFIHSLTRTTELPRSTMPAMTIRDYLDRATAAEPQYEWHEVGGTPVVRPRVAWSEKNNSLNQRFDVPLELTDVTLGEALKALCAGRCKVSWSGRTDREPYRFSVHFDGGTFLDAIEAVMRAHGPVVWRYSHLTRATNVMVMGKRMPDEVLHYELLQATPVGIRW